MSFYLNNPWKPRPQSVLKDSTLAADIDENGFRVGEFLSEGELSELKSIFDKHHDFRQDKGGMFYSVYSRDLTYRKQVYADIEAVIAPKLDQWFKDYRVVLYSYVVKVNGPESDFYLHQDTTGLDESKFSGLNLWIPLTDVNMDNGCMVAVPRSHRFFTPFRSISFPAPFDNIQQKVHEYLQPIDMKAGQALFFDNRIVHKSTPNTSDETRVAIVVGILPKDAKLTTVHKVSYTYGGEVELIEHDDDFLLTYPKFLIDCQDRPHVGNSIGTRPDPFPEISASEFDALCAKFGVAPNRSVAFHEKVNCNLIGEPS